MSKLAMEKTEILKKELEARGCDTSSVKPAKRTWTVGVQKSLWQYFDGIEADTEAQAKEIALSRLKDGDWADYNNELTFSDCYETTDR